MRIFEFKKAKLYDIKWCEISTVGYRKLQNLKSVLENVAKYVLEGTQSRG